MAGEQDDDKYRKAFESLQDPTRDALRLSRQAGYGLPPEKAREILKVARDSALPPQHLEDALDPAYKDKLEDRLSEDRYDAILRNAPSTARWATDPFRHAAGKEDLDRLARIEGLLRGQGVRKPSQSDLAGRARAEGKAQAPKAWEDLQRRRTATSSLGLFRPASQMGSDDTLLDLARNQKDVEEILSSQAFKRLKYEADDTLDKLPVSQRPGAAISMGFMQGYRESQLGQLGELRRAGDRSQETLAAIQAIEASLVNRPGGQSFARFLYPVSKTLGQMLGSANKATKRAYQGAAAGAAASALTGPAAPAVVAEAALAGGVAGFGAGMVEQAFILEAGNAYLDLEKLRDAEGREIPEGTKQTTATVVGLVNATLESVGLALLTKPLRSVAKEFITTSAKESIAKPTVQAALARFGKEYAVGVGGETSTEIVQELVTVMGEEIAKMATSGDFQTFANSPEVRAQIWERLIEVASDTLQSSIVLGGLGGGVRLAADVRQVRDQRKAEQAQELATQFFEELKIVEKEVAQSELAKENLEEIERVAHDALLDTGHPFRYLPAKDAAEYFQQKGLDPVAEVAKLTGVEMTPEQFVQAVERGGDIQFPAEKYISISQGEHVAFFQEVLRRDADEMNMAETKVAVSEARAQEKAAAEKEQATQQTEEQKAAVAKVKDDLDRIGAAVAEGLAAGGFKAEAKRMSAVARKVFERLAARTGRSVNDLWNDFGIQVRKGAEAEAAPAGKAIEQPAADAFPRAGETVDGRAIRGTASNQDSIEASLTNYEVQEGVREVPFSAFTQMPELKYYSPEEEQRTKALAEEIKASGEIEPLIVVMDKDGPYVLEGAHRFDALRELGAKSFPAIVVRDLDSVPETRTLNQSSPDAPTLSEEDKKFLNWEPERTEAGKLKGAPEWVRSARQMPALRRRVRGLTREGLPGRFWYEDSAREVLRITGGDYYLAAKFIQLLAIYSPRANVWVNTMSAIRVFNQWRSGAKREDIHAGTQPLDEKARAALFDNKSWDGRKTKSFDKNLMAQLIADATPEQIASMKLDPDVLKDIQQAVTVDLWMYRAFGYRRAQGGDDIGGGKYSFVENEVRRITAELNADLRPGEPRWLPRQVQAAIWTSIKARHEVKSVIAKTKAESVRKGLSRYAEDGKTWEAPPESSPQRVAHDAVWLKHAMQAAPEESADQVEQAKGSFADAIQQMAYTALTEAVPSPDLGLAITGAPLDLRLAYTREMLAVLQRNGMNDLAAKLGLTLGVTEMGTGGWEGEVNPNIVTSLVPSKPAGDFDPTLIDRYARAFQIIFRQKAVPYFRADPDAQFEADPEKKFNGTYFTINPTTGKTVRRYETQAEAEAEAKEKGLEVRGDPVSRAVLFSWQEPLTPAQEATFWESLQKALNGKAGYTKLNSTDIVVANFRDDVTGLPFLNDEDFVDGIVRMKEADGGRLGFVEAVEFGAHSKYGPTQDWAADPGAAALYSSVGTSGSPDLQDWIRSRADEVARLTAERWGTQEALAQRAAELGVGQRVPRVLMQPAFHGSPRKHRGKFSTKYIGTGEGAQVFGWGLYFAGNKKVAQYYREALAGPINDKTMKIRVSKDAPEHLRKNKKAVKYASEAHRSATYWNAAQEGLNMTPLEALTQEGWPDPATMNEEQKQLFEDAKALLPFIKVDVPGRLFKVEIPSDENYLNFEKKVKDQPEVVKRAFRDMGYTPEGYEALVKKSLKESGRDDLDPSKLPFPDSLKGFQELTGQEAYEFLSLEFGGNDEAVSKELRKHGVLGNMYSDEGSRLRKVFTPNGPVYRIGDDDTRDFATVQEALQYQQEHGTYNYVVFDERDITTISYEQPAPGKGPRGRIVIGNSSFAIDLFESADRSTFLHEIGHFYLEVMQELAAKPGADAGILADLAAIREWMGLKDGEAISDDQHEKFARAFELYLSKGQAPTKTLEKAFWHFKRWINDIYREVKDYFTGIEISPKLKDVLDRMLASEDEIFEARMEMGGSLLEGPAAEILTPEQRRRLQAAQDEAVAEAEARMLAPLMQELDREDEAKWKEDREKLKQEELAKLREEPVYKLLRALTMKKEDAGPDDWVGKIKTSRVENVLSALPRGITAEDGVRPEFLVDWFQQDGRQFKNVNEMLYALASAEDINVVAARRADERMLALNPRMTPEEIHAKAREALHGPKREALLRLEMELLAESAQGKAAVKDLAFYKPRLDVLANEARLEIEGVAVGALRPASYLAAEKRAAKEMLAAALKGDLRSAIDAKLRELMNHERVRAAVAARDGVKEFIAETRKMAKSDEKIAKTRDLDLVNAARAILAKWGVGRWKGEPSEYLGQLAKYDKAVYETILGDVLEATRDARPYKEATVAEFERMREAVEALWDIAKSTRELTVEGKKVDFEEGKTALLENTEALPADYANYGLRGNPTLWERIKVGFLSLKALGRRAEPWCRAMGDNFTRYIWNPVNDAIGAYRVQRVDVLRKYLEAVKARPEIFKDEPIDAPELGAGFTFESKAHLLAAVLHSGNDSNLMKLVVGYKWGEWDPETETFERGNWDSFVDRMQSKGILTKADYEFCQAVWDLNESIKPTAQRAHKEMFGRYFKEVTANAVTTRFGTFRGGYVPATINTEIVQDVGIKKALEEHGGFNAEYALPTTTKGFTIARAKGYAAPLLLDLRLIPRHLDEVLRFAHIQPRVNEVHRLLKDKEVAGAIQAHDPAVVTGMLLPWLDRAVKQRVETAGMSRGLDRFFRAIRGNAGMQIMVGNITNAMQNVTGLSVARTMVKGKYLRNAAWHWMTDHKAFVQGIKDRSAFMKNLLDNDAQEMLRQIEEIVTNPNAFQKLQAASRKHGQILQLMTQNPVSMIAWQGAFEQAMEGLDGNSETDVNAAIRQADAVVRQTQGAQGAENISRFEAGTPFAKLFTQFMGYFNNKANLLGTEYDVTVRELGLKKGAGRLFGVYFFGHAVPAIIGTVILKWLAGTWSDEDDDGYIDEIMAAFFGSQVREALGYFPVVGNVANMTIEGLGGGSYNDRIMNAPALSAFEKAAQYTGTLKSSIEDGEVKKKLVVDTLSILGLFTGTPTGALGRPIGYAMDLEAGKANPDSPAGVIRGLLTGKRGE